MNDYQLTRENIELTKNWTLSDWKQFRSKYNYWQTKDVLMKGKEYYRFKKFKNLCIKNFLDKR